MIAFIEDIHIFILKVPLLNTKTREANNFAIKSNKTKTQPTISQSLAQKFNNLVYATISFLIFFFHVFCKIMHIYIKLFASKGKINE